MADRRLFHMETLNAGTNNIFEFPVFPSGKKVYVEKFGGLDRAQDTSRRGSVFLLQWGENGDWSTEAAISVVGATYEVDVLKEFACDGTKKFRVLQYNDSTTNKQIMWWVRGKDIN